LPAFQDTLQGLFLGLTVHLATSTKGGLFALHVPVLVLEKRSGPYSI
jgi:hypothetical protein